MKATRVAVVAGTLAGLVVIACTDSTQKTITAPSGPRNSTIFGGGFANAKTVVVCVDAASPAGTYMFKNSGFLSPYSFAPFTGPPIDGANGGNGTTTENVADGTEYPIAVGACQTVLTRTVPDTFYPGFADSWSGITVQASTIPATAIYSKTDCFLDSGTRPSIPNPCGASNNPTRAYANFDHGTRVTFFFALRPPPPADCVLGYPFGTLPARSAVAFNESEVLAAYGRGGNELRLWYTDEHALTLGVRRVVVTSPASTTDYTVSPLLTNPGSTTSPAVGTTALTGNQRGTDPADRPLWPSLFITDLTVLGASSKAGDWQSGGTSTAPNAVYGTWKGAVATVGATRTITPDADPAVRNHFNLGAVPPAAAVPAGVSDLGYSAEVVWSISSLGLDPTHNYRLQFMVHDGDQNKTGGDVGQACLNIGPGSPTDFFKLPPTPPKCVNGQGECS